MQYYYKGEGTTDQAPIFSKTLQIKPGPRLWIILFRSVLEVFTEAISREMIAEQVRQSCRASAGQEVGAKRRGGGQN